MCVYLYIYNKYAQHTYIYYVYKNFYFECDRLTALLYTHTHTYISFLFVLFYIYIFISALSCPVDVRYECITIDFCLFFSVWGRSWNDFLCNSTSCQMSAVVVHIKALRHSALLIQIQSIYKEKLVLVMFLICKSIRIKASAKWINVHEKLHKNDDFNTFLKL